MHFVSQNSLAGILEPFRDCTVPSLSSTPTAKGLGSAVELFEKCNPYMKTDPFLTRAKSYVLFTSQCAKFLIELERFWISLKNLGSVGCRLGHPAPVHEMTCTCSNASAARQQKEGISLASWALTTHVRPRSPTPALAQTQPSHSLKLRLYFLVS